MCFSDAVVLLIKNAPRNIMTTWHDTQISPIMYTMRHALDNAIVEAVANHEHVDLRMSANSHISLISYLVRYSTSLKADSIFLSPSTLGERMLILIKAILRKCGREELGSQCCGPRFHFGLQSNSTVFRVIYSNQGGLPLIYRAQIARIFLDNHIHMRMDGTYGEGKIFFSVRKMGRAASGPKTTSPRAHVLKLQKELKEFHF